jgi:hypothetical protein
VLYAVGAIILAIGLNWYRVKPLLSARLIGSVVAAGNDFRYWLAVLGFLILAARIVPMLPEIIPMRQPGINPTNYQEGQPARQELEAQKATLNEWLQQTQRERDRARQELDQLQKQMQDVRLRAPSAIPIPTKQQPNPQVCADLLRLLSNLSTEKHAWHGDEDVRSVMKNLGCFAPEK